MFRSDSGNLDVVEVTDTLALAIWHKIVEVVEFHCRGKLLTCIVDIDGAVK